MIILCTNITKKLPKLNNDWVCCNKKEPINRYYDNCKIKFSFLKIMMRIEILGFPAKKENPHRNIRENFCFFCISFSKMRKFCKKD